MEAAGQGLEPPSHLFGAQLAIVYYVGYVGVHGHLRLTWSDDAQRHLGPRPLHGTGEF